MRMGIKEIRSEAREIVLSLEADRKVGLEPVEHVRLARLIFELADYLMPKTVKPGISPTKKRFTNITK